MSRRRACSADIKLRRAESTVQWAVDKLKADYFCQDPAEIIMEAFRKRREAYVMKLAFP